jgi:hypothetical protein
MYKISLSLWRKEYLFVRSIPSLFFSIRYIHGRDEVPSTYWHRASFSEYFQAWAQANYKTFLLTWWSFYSENIKGWVGLVQGYYWPTRMF